VLSGLGFALWTVDQQHDEALTSFRHPRPPVFASVLESNQIASVLESNQICLFDCHCYARIIFVSVNHQLQNVV
jgi:hypothetical protein